MLKIKLKYVVRIETKYVIYQKNKKKKGVGDTQTCGEFKRKVFAFKKNAYFVFLFDANLPLLFLSNVMDKNFFTKKFTNY